MGDQGKLLIVDDEKEIVAGLKEILSDHISHIEVAYDGKEALEIIKNQQNDILCVATDIHMPIMNGIELIKQVRHLHIEIPFIFFTGFDRDDYVRDAAKYGAFDFVMKPNFNGLEATILSGIKYGFDLKHHKSENEDFMKEFIKLPKDG